MSSDCYLHSQYWRLCWSEGGWKDLAIVPEVTINGKKKTLKKSPCRALSTRSGSSYSLYYFQFFFTVNLCGLPGLSLSFFAVFSSSQLIPPKIKLLCELFYFLMDGFLHHIHPLATLLIVSGLEFDDPRGPLNPSHSMIL